MSHRPIFRGSEPKASLWKALDLDQGHHQGLGFLMLKMESGLITKDSSDLIFWNCKRKLDDCKLGHRPGSGSSLGSFCGIMPNKHAVSACSRLCEYVVLCVVLGHGIKTDSAHQNQLRFRKREESPGPDLVLLFSLKCCLFSFQNLLWYLGPLWTNFSS